VAQAQQQPPAKGEGGVPKGPEPLQSGHTYGNFGPRDEQIWRASTEQVVSQGNAIFHDATKLGGTIGVSCDMCHPNAANTHPETYPKFQVQLGRVALLRDMINWCIENPVRGKPLADDDDRLKALEAFIIAQRKGVALEYGKH
jgi:cytochrome c